MWISPDFDEPLSDEELAEWACEAAARHALLAVAEARSDPTKLTLEGTPADPRVLAYDVRKIDARK
jgi:hypothetical protein